MMIKTYDIEYDDKQHHQILEDINDKFVSE